MERSAVSTSFYSLATALSISLGKGQPPEPYDAIDYNVLPATKRDRGWQRVYDG